MRLTSKGYTQMQSAIDNAVAQALQSMAVRAYVRKLIYGYLTDVVQTLRADDAEFGSALAVFVKAQAADAQYMDMRTYVDARLQLRDDKLDARIDARIKATLEALATDSADGHPLDAPFDAAIARAIDAGASASNAVVQAVDDSGIVEGITDTAEFAQGVLDTVRGRLVN